MRVIGAVFVQCQPTDNEARTVIIHHQISHDVKSSAHCSLQVLKFERELEEGRVTECELQALCLPPSGTSRGEGDEVQLAKLLAISLRHGLPALSEPPSQGFASCAFLCLLVPCRLLLLTSCLRLHFWVRGSGLPEGPGPSRPSNCPSIE